MIATIENFIPAPKLKKITSVLESGVYQDGGLSAGKEAKAAKDNQELQVDSVDIQALNEMVMGNLVRHPDYRPICWPRRIAAPLYVRYQQGMQYGEHVDDPVMGQNDPYRSDISLTIFLSPIDAYKGGELTIVEPGGKHTIRLDAGCAVFYPATSRHYVTPVTEGTRYVAVSWIQSSIRDAARRELLYELNQAREILLAEQPGSTASNKVSASFNNLVRRWVEL